MDLKPCRLKCIHMLYISCTRAMRDTGCHVRVTDDNQDDQCSGETMVAKVEPLRFAKIGESHTGT